MPGSKNKKKVNKRKGGAGTPAGSAKVPRVEDGEINTLGATELSRKSTRVTESGEGKSGLSGEGKSGLIHSWYHCIATLF